MAILLVFGVSGCGSPFSSDVIGNYSVSRRSREKISASVYFTIYIPVAYILISHVFNRELVAYGVGTLDPSVVLV